MSETKTALIKDIEQLLNSYEGIAPTRINPELLQFMDEASLKSIIGSLIEQKGKTLENNSEWLQQFKSHEKI